MYITQIIKILTLSLFITSVCHGRCEVKDILNSISTLSTSYHIDHATEMVTEVKHYILEEHKNDGQQIVVIDAGHGGHDPGTHGKHSKEKDIALQIAMQLGKELQKKSNTVQIVYTRTKDVFIPLHKRIGIANDKKADLFVSIHCNYVGNPNVCGTETFVMGLHSAEENLNVAKRENSSILLENKYETTYNGYDPNSPVGHILLSMIQNVFLDHSIDLANKIENQLNGRKRTKSRGVKQAGFVVLRQATMPSILVETGFLSNPQEEKYLLSKSGQAELASKIGQGILSYFGTLNTITKIESTSIENQHSNITKKNGKYIIQVGVFSKKKDKRYEKVLASYGDLIISSINSKIRYAVGFYPTRNDAFAVLQDMKKNGYTDAFVKATK